MLALHVTAGWIESYDNDLIMIYKLGSSEYGCSFAILNCQEELELLYLLELLIVERKLLP